MRAGARARRAVLAAVLAVGLTPPAAAETLVAGTARNADGVLVVVRSDGVETRLRGRGALQVFEGDLLRVEGRGAFIETAEGIQVALNGNAVVMVLSRWEKGSGLTRILRVRSGEVWTRSEGQRPVELETPVAVLASRGAEVSIRMISENDAVATVVKGTADFATPLGACRLRAGTLSSATRGKTCTSPTAVDVQPVVGWSQPLLP